MSALRNMTAQELFEYRHEPLRTELIAGRLIEMECADALHGVVAGRICALLGGYVHERGLGQVFATGTGFHLWAHPDTVRAPDASYVSRARIEAIGGIPSQYFPGPPDLAFEVTSPRDRRSEVESKTRSWLDAGTQAVVVVDPRKRIATIHRPPGASQSCSGDELLA